MDSMASRGMMEPDPRLDPAYRNQSQGRAVFSFIKNISTSTSHTKTLSVRPYGILAIFVLAHSFMNRF